MLKTREYSNALRMQVKIKKPLLPYKNMNNIEQETVNKKVPQKKSLSFFSVLLISVIILLGIFSVMEIAARAGLFSQKLPLQSVGNHHAQFEIKWFKLQEYVEKNGGVDVILLGSSMLNTGVDPDLFTPEYEKNTGTKLRVFNFGVEGLTVAPDSELAALLVQTYHPKALVYFTEIRDYIGENGVEEEKTFLSSDWLSYKMGNLNFRGWLIDHSSALQYWLPFRGWSRADFLDTYILSTRRERNTTESGYEYEQSERQNLEMRPDPNNPDEQSLFELYGNFSFDQQRLEDLNAILSLQDETTAIFISEIPADPAFYDYFGGEAVHNAYYENITEYVEEKGGFFVPMVSAENIPIEGRADDYVHLNLKGAKLYSVLLAQQFSDLCLDQSICLGSTVP